jgi:hypothetical protein
LAKYHHFISLTLSGQGPPAVLPVTPEISWIFSEHLHEGKNHPSAEANFTNQI